MATISQTFLIPSNPIEQNSNPRKLRTTYCLSFKETSNQDHNVEKWRDDLQVMFAAGGTGGHIYPAIAVADQLKTINPKIRILFIGTPNGMESIAVPSAGYDFKTVPATPLARPLVSLQNIFVFPFQLAKSVIISFQELQKFDPDIVVGTGGYVSFPVCLAAALKGVNLVIQEQNSVPGIANWWLSFLADTVLVAFHSTVDSFVLKKKCVVCGNPVRLSLTRYVSRAVARTHFFPRAGNPDAKVLLVLGGSLGANAINIALLNLYYELLERKDFFIIWQTGVEAFDEMESLVKNHPNVILTAFLHSMDLAYAAADLIVSRAGAMTCCEILATGKPSILIPSPNVAEGHQFNNASLMADLAGSRIITEDELDSTTLEAEISEILDNESLMAEMSQRALQAAKPNACAEIAEEIIALVRLSKSK